MQAAQQVRSRVSRDIIVRAVLVLYIVLSAAYILFTQFQSYQAQVVQEAYLSGRVTTIEELIGEAEASCQPFPIYSGDKQIELINVACLLPPESDDAEAPIPSAPGSE